MLAYGFRSHLQNLFDQEFGHVFKAILDEYDGAGSDGGVEWMEFQKWPHNVVPYHLDPNLKNNVILHNCFEYWNATFANHVQFLDVSASKMPQNMKIS